MSRLNEDRRIKKAKAKGRASLKDPKARNPYSKPSLRAAWYRGRDTESDHERVIPTKDGIPVQF